LSGRLPPTPRAAFALGAREMLPAIPAMAAWSLVTGVAMAQSALTLAQAIGMSLIAYAGAAQLAALPLMVAGAPVGVTVLSALMVNLRFVIYSAALAPTLRMLPLRKRLGLGYLVSDMGFVFYMRREAALRDDPMRTWYFLGLSMVVFVVWHGASLVGLLAAAAIPTRWGLEFVGTLALLALLVPMLAARPARVGALVAGVLSLTLRGLPYKLGVVSAILAGILASVLAERRTEAAR
jgi:predicted branched-subunit amino acid permease